MTRKPKGFIKVQLPRISPLHPDLEKARQPHGCKSEPGDPDVKGRGGGVCGAQLDCCKTQQETLRNK